MALKGLGKVLPFLNFQDTTFYVPLDGREDPPVYAFDINETPTVRRVAGSLLCPRQEVVRACLGATLP